MTTRIHERFSWLVFILFWVTACTATPVQPTFTPTATIPPTETPEPTETFTPAPTSPPFIIPKTEALRPEDQAYIRVVHAAPALDRSDIYVEMLLVADNMTFQQNTASIGIEAGTYVVRLTPSGEQPLENALAEQSVTIEGGDNLILLITSVEDQIVIETVPEVVDPLRSNEARVTFVHAVPRGADFIVEEDEEAITPQLTFGQTSPAVIHSEGRASFVLQSGDQTLQRINTELEARNNYTFILMGNAAQQQSLQIVSFNTVAAGITRFRVINASPDIGRVSFFAGSTQLDTHGFGYSEASARIPMASGSYTMDIYPYDADHSIVQPLVSTQISATANFDTSIVLMGTPDSLRIVTVNEDNSPTKPEEARIMFLNTLPNVPQVFMEANEIATIVSYAEASESYTIGSFPTSFHWSILDANDEIGDLIESADQYPLREGTRYLYLFAGRQSDPILIYEDFVGFYDEENPEQSVLVTEEPIPSSHE